MDQIIKYVTLKHVGSVQTLSSGFSANKQQSPDNVQNSKIENVSAEEPCSNKTVLVKTRITKHQCPECKETFVKISSLYRHVSTKHPDQLTNIFPEDKKFMCNICKKTFNCMGSVRTHRRRHHNQYIVVKTHKCPLCPEELERRDFSKHFESIHSLLLEAEKLKFNNYVEFLIWKQDMEKETQSYFTKVSSKTTDTYVRHWFNCHRSGNYISQVNEGKRKMRTKGSRKINAYCPASITVTAYKGKKCDVIFQSHHLGHDNEIRHLNLSAGDRQIIAEKLASDLPLDVILKDLRNSTSDDGSQRLQFLNRRDILNVKYSLLKGESSDYDVNLAKGKIAERLNEIKEKHFASVNMKAELAVLENGWMFTSTESNEMYFIKENQVACDCPLFCTYCKACVQSYSCSCSASAIKGTMCEHIHFFCTVRNQEVNDSSDENDLVDCGELQEMQSEHEESDSLQGDTISNDTPVASSAVSLEQRNDLKQKYVDLIDSIITTQEYEVLENTLSQLTPQLITIRNDSVSKIVSSSATNGSSNSVPANENIRMECSPESPKSHTTPLIHQIQMPTKSESPRVYYIVNPGLAQHVQMPLYATYFKVSN